jgi:phage-related protein
LVAPASWSWSKITAAARIGRSYTGRFVSAIYVLYVFQKTSKHGRQTPQEDVALIKRRLRQAEEIDAAR